MANLLRHLVVVALLTTSATLGAAQASGTSPNTGHTTRYWDCCKSSCAWPGKAPVSAPVASCDIHGQRLSDPNAPSGCDHGSAYMCADQSPWAVSNDLAYGFAAVNLAGNNENSWCCACYELTFTSGAVAGKKMVVQATNTGGDLGTNQFDLAMPGGGVGAFNGCSKQWGAPPSGYGAQYGGISSNTCSSLASALQPGCNFRFGWFQGAENPSSLVREL
ncbi:MAG: Endoglucanase 5A [Pleopsidium flavum]|nr:MAG: Endoglucanase 5A [Pleopsidium flavum]